MHQIRFLLLILIIAAASTVASAQKVSHAKQSSPSKEGAAMKDGKNTAVVETSLGSFEIQLYAQDAPKTVENFKKLALKKFFDGMRVHRVSKGFVVQTGDEKSKDLSKVGEWGTGGQSIWGKPFEDELNPITPSYKEGYKTGVVAMANRGPNTNTSQFFVCLQNISLPHNYTIFGKVTKGMDVVEKIGTVEIIPGRMGPTDGRPKTDVVIKKITMK